MDVNTDYPNPAAVRGLTDNRTVPLARLAERGAAASENLRRALPTEEDGRVTVAAFGSSI